MFQRYNEESNGSNNAENQNEETFQSSATYLLVTGHKNGNIRFWDTESGRLVTTLSSHKSQVNALAFSPLPNSQNTSTYNDDSLLRLISVGSDLALKVIKLYNRVILNVSYFKVLALRRYINPILFLFHGYSGLGMRILRIQHVSKYTS